jgi:hypothetical protein
MEHRPVSETNRKRRSRIEQISWNSSFVRMEFEHSNRLGKLFVNPVVFDAFWNWDLFVPGVDHRGKVRLSR